MRRDPPATDLQMWDEVCYGDIEQIYFVTSLSKVSFEQDCDSRGIPTCRAPSGKQGTTQRTGPTVDPGLRRTVVEVDGHPT